MRLLAALLTWQKSWHVFERDDRDVERVTETNKSRALHRRIDVQTTCMLKSVSNSCSIGLKRRGRSRGWVTRVNSHPPGVAAYFMLFIMHATKVISMSFCAPPRAKSWRQTLKFHSLVSPDPSMLARFARSGSQSHPPLKNPRSANACAACRLEDDV